jgi:hypothetical protein
VHLLLDEVALTGGSQIISYIVSWDQGLGGSFTELSGDSEHSLETSLIFVTDIVSGVYFRFKYSARNVHGDGEYSDEFTVLSATTPTEMGTPTIQINENASYRVSFLAPGSGGNDVEVTSYEIELKDNSSGEFYQASSCTDISQISSDLYCDIPL